MSPWWSELCSYPHVAEWNAFEVEPEKESMLVAVTHPNVEETVARDHILVLVILFSKIEHQHSVTGSNQRYRHIDSGRSGSDDDYFSHCTFTFKQA